MRASAGCVLSLDPESLKSYLARLHAEPPDSRFPTVNKYFQRFPHLSIAWAVDDFYRWQQLRYYETDRLIRTKHLWDWYETCYKFLYAAYQLRKENESTLQSFLVFLNGEGRTSKFVDWKPEAPLGSRRSAQFAAVKMIWRKCVEEGYAFPLDFCPGGATPMEYFRPSPQPGSGGVDIKTVFRRCHKRFDARTAEGVEIRNEISIMFAFKRPEEYYALGRSAVWECCSVQDDVEESDVMMQNPGDSEESSVVVPESHPISAPLEMDGQEREEEDEGYQTTRSAAGRIVSSHTNSGCVEEFF